MEPAAPSPRSFMRSALFASIAAFLLIVLLWIFWPSNSKKTEKPATLPRISSYEDCKKSPGSIIQQTYPEVCVTKSGVRFTQPVSTQAEDTNTLIIKEWGLKAKYPKSLTLVYRVAQNEGPIKDAAFFSSAELTKATNGGRCSIEASTDGSYFYEGAGSILRYLSNESVNISTDSGNVTSSAQDYAKTISNDDYIKIGDYYYFISPGEGGSCVPPAGAETDLNQVEDAIKGVIKSLTPIAT